MQNQYGIYNIITHKWVMADDKWGEASKTIRWRTSKENAEWMLNHLYGTPEKRKCQEVGEGWEVRKF